MQLTQNLYDHFAEKARGARVTRLSVGLKYTAVQTDDGGMGVAFTYAGNAHGCARKGEYRDYEGEPAIELLPAIIDSSPLNRSLGLALVNALNHSRAAELPEESGEPAWMEAFGIGSETRVAMVGFFKPLMKKFKERGATVDILDDLKGVGNRSEFLEKLKDRTQVLLLTSTSILNDSTEEMLARLNPEAKTVMIGPSTPLVPDAFRHLPVHMLAGTLPEDQTGVLKAVRHGQGTPVIHRFSRKVYAAMAPLAG